ncbi:MAG: hypothetical protein U0411_07555 [Thermodesulfovibrionales bacterium]
MMRAVCWEGKNEVHVRDVPLPEVLNPRDAGGQAEYVKEDGCIKVALKP